MSKIFVISLESVPTRYTHYWKEHLPKMLREHTGVEVVSIDGIDQEVEATPGAFLNFTSTNIFKSYQAIQIAELFETNQVGSGDVFLFADAGNPAILMVRYMIDLMDVDAKIASIWHAGSYDPADFLGRKIEKKGWSYNAERSFFYACDVNFFATQFHIDMMTSTLGLDPEDGSIVRTGFPMEYIQDVCHWGKKEDVIVFPHRLSEEKNYELFKKISAELPEYEFVVCQEQKLSKDEYYDVLAKSKIIFSANKQETLGIGTFEGLMSGAFAYVPNMLSYKEMYALDFQYESEYIDDVDFHVGNIKEIMEDYGESVAIMIEDEGNHVFNEFFTGTMMYETLKEMTE